jgi:hypothetical protein
MTARITKPQCVLLDANVVIEAHKSDIWLQLTERYELIPPATIIRTEARYFKTARRIPKPVRVRELVAKGDISELTATAGELAAVHTIFASWFLDTLDPGETEALALLKANKAPEACFCTSDASAIKALAMMGVSERGISTETLLAKVGLKKNLGRHYTEDSFRMNIRRGQVDKITGDGLAIA